MQRSEALSTPRGRVDAREVALCVLFAALVALGSWIRIPLPNNPVPLTMQVFFVLLAGATLRPAAAACSMGLFVMTGLAGAPVYAGGAAGFAHLMGATGGYLLSYIVAAPAVAWMLAGRRGSPLRVVLAMIGGVAVILLMGSAWLSVFLGGDVAAAVRLGILPWLPGDVLKIAAAAATVSAGAAITTRR